MEQSARAPRHPLEVKPLSSNARFKQSRYDILNPVPVKCYSVSSSGGGESSAAISAIEALLPIFNNFAVFSHTIKVDPSFDGLLAKIKLRLMIAFWGNYDSSDGQGALCLEDGTEYREKEVWHGPYQGDQVTHWVRGHSSGTRYSCVVFHGPPARSTRRATRPEMRGSIPDDKTA